MTAHHPQPPYTEVEIEQDIAWLWLNRPETGNAVDATMICELTEQFRELDQRSDINVIVLAGRGNVFSQGADLHWMLHAAQLNDAQNMEDARQLTTMFHTISKCSKPTIARVHGPAIGAGAGLMSACDISIAGRQALFAITEVRAGIMPAALSPYVIDAIGPHQARRYFLTGERFGAEDAWRIGLIHECVESAVLDQRVRDVIQQLKLGCPVSQHETKRLIDSVSHAEIDISLAEETAHRICKLRATPGAQARLKSALAAQQASQVEAIRDIDYEECMTNA